MRPLRILSKTIITPPSTSSSSSSLRQFSVLTSIKSSFRQFHSPTSLQPNHRIRQISSTPLFKMSFSNTNVPGDKPADPYKATNLTDPDLKEKIQDLVSFIESCKFGMMTTRIESSGLLTSRCMALAAKVRLPFPSLYNTRHPQESGADRIHYHRKEVVLTSFSTPTPSPARPMISSPNLRSTSLSSTPRANGPLSQAKLTLSLTVRWSANTTLLP